jgi:uncharacterized damage-inducible protein DinB
MNLEELQYPIGRFQQPETYTPQLIKGWIKEIAALPSWVDALVQNLDAGHLEIPYREGGWNTTQVVHHLADSHMNAFTRTKLALTEDNPTIKPYDEAAWAELYDGKILPLNYSVTLLHALHYRWTMLLERLTEEQLERTFFHPEQQRSMPIKEQIAVYAWHGRHHTEQILSLRRRLGWVM